MLFVYGTLMSRFENAHAATLRHAATLLGAAAFPGRMFVVRGPRGLLVYPAVTPSAEPSDVVHGELYRLEDERVLDRLDAYEGSEYVRTSVEVRTHEGAAHRALIYLYTGDTRALRRIPTGRFDDASRRG